jgi:hypothetical protein
LLGPGEADACQRLRPPSAPRDPIATTSSGWTGCCAGGCRAAAVELEGLRRRLDRHRGARLGDLERQAAALVDLGGHRIPSPRAAGADLTRLLWVRAPRRAVASAGMLLATDFRSSS